MHTNHKEHERLPRWLKACLPMGEKYSFVSNIVEHEKLHTICKSGLCPNIGECWNAGTATFMILGDCCTRNCMFCNVKHEKPQALDKEEAYRIALSVQKMQLRHCVITSVTRDDLPDGGAAFWAYTINTIKSINPGITLEVLIPDFNGKKELVQQIIDAAPEIISHNLETVERLTPMIRSKARYTTSLNVIKTIASSGIPAKSGIMLGLGESHEEILKTMDDLLAAGCSIITLGQYLRPSANNIPVAAYIPPEKFTEYRNTALEKGFAIAESAPLVRSSYHSHEQLLAVKFHHVVG